MASYKREMRLTKEVLPLPVGPINKRFDLRRGNNMSEDNRKNTTEDSISKDGFFKRNKNRILYGVAIALPCLSIIVLIAGSPVTWFKEDPIEAYNKNVASSASSNTSTSSTSTSSGSSSGSSSTSSTSGARKSKSNARKAAENYDAGYNAIYEDDDYSQSRYNRDKDYAMGVDDAIDDLDWE